MDLNDEWETFLESNINLNINNDRKTTLKKNTPKCSELYVSTQTKIAYLSEPINLYDIFWDLKILPYHEFKEGLLKKSIKINSLSKEEVDELDLNIKKEREKNVYLRCNIINQINDPSSRKIKFKDVRKIICGISSKDLLCSKKKLKVRFIIVSL